MEDNFIEWAIYFRGIDKNGNGVWVFDTPDLLLDQFNKSAKILYDSIKNLRVFIHIKSDKYEELFNFKIRSGELPINKGIEGVRKLLKNLPSIVRRIDSIIVYKQRGRF